MLSKYVRKSDDCGCGGGKHNCISKNTFARLLQAELKRLDCGCGCKGVKGFKKKYGLKGGKILADCPPGWRNDGLTCVENCNADERDDGLTCRKRCPEGQIDDGLTCRVPITSSMNDCPQGSRDIAGTCWGPVRRDCVDDCFKHPAPGCRTWECGRLRGLFGEDWGPRWCTDCNLRCGQTCWDVQGITKQLHERDLRIRGGEVYGQSIRGKQIRGRVDFAELGKSIESGLADTFSRDSAFAKLFDPEQNGVGAAFRKFGDDIKKVVEDVANKIKEGFDKMGADIKKAFEDFARDAESKFKQFGDDFVRMMKDPDFWVEAIGIMAQIAAAAVSIAITVGTLGAGSALAVGLMAAAQMAGPAAKMIADAARGRPIDALDIISLAASAATAFVPGMGPTVGAMVRTGANAAKYAVQGVQMAQALNLVPSTCIANCPPQPPFPPEPPIEPTPPPSDVPPPPGQKTDEEILALAPPCTFLRVIGKPNQPAPCNVPPKVTRSGPPYYTDAEWIAKYRAENYGPGAANQTVVDESGALVDKDDDNIKGEVDATEGEQVDLTDVEVPELEEIDFGEPTGEIDFGEPTGEIDFGEPAGEIDFGETAEEIDFGEPMGEIDFGAPAEEIDFGEEMGAGKKRRKRRGGQLGPIIEPITVDGVVTNPGGSMVSLPPKANIPKTEAGFEFDAGCYAQNNPELAKEVGSNRQKLTFHWFDIGSKKGWDADCGGIEAARQRAIEEQREKERIAALKSACNASDRFFVASTQYCDGTRNADGSANTGSEECRRNNGHWDYTGTKSFCNSFKNPNGRLKTREDICNSSNNYWDSVDKTCDYFRNVDGALKTEADVCTGFDAFWNPDTKRCLISKNRDGEPVDDEQLCLNNVDYWDGTKCNEDKFPDGRKKPGDTMCKVVDGGTDYTGPETPYSPAACKNKLARLPNSQKQKRELVDKYVLSPEMRFNEKLMKEVPELEITGFAPERAKGSARKRKLKGKGMSRDEYNALLQRKRQELRSQINDSMATQRAEFDKTFDDLVNKKLEALEYDYTKDYDQFDVVTIRDPTSPSKYKAKVFKLVNGNFQEVDTTRHSSWTIDGPYFWFDFLFDRAFNPYADPEWKNKHFQPDRALLQAPPTPIEEEQVRRKIDLLEYKQGLPYKEGDIVTLKDPKDPTNIWKTHFLRVNWTYKPDEVLTYPPEGTSLLDHLTNIMMSRQPPSLGFSPVLNKDVTELGYKLPVDWDLELDIPAGARWDFIINRYTNSQMYAGSGKRKKNSRK
jgi:hypothetical protein